MSSSKIVTTSGSTSREIKSSSVQEQRSSTSQQSSRKAEVSKTSGSEHITTIYDADGNVVKTIRHVDNQAIQNNPNRSLEYTNASHDRKHSDTSDRSATMGQNVKKIDIRQEYDNRAESPTPSQSDSVATTYLVDENYVDTNKMRNKTVGSDFKNFYGHGIDSSKTVVSNTYDNNAVQNAIGTRGRVIMDHNIDTTDVVFSNDRNYGKTGWNGQFLYEQPQEEKIVQVRQQKPWEKPLRGKSRLRPEDLPPAGVPTVRK